MRNYLEYKVLFCKQEENYIFAIINIHDTLTMQDRVTAISVPSIALGITQHIDVLTTYELEARVTNALSLVIEAGTSIPTSQVISPDVARTLTTKLNTSLIKLNSNSACIVLDSTPIYLPINTLFSVYDTLSVNFTYTTPIPTEAYSTNVVSSTYETSPHLITLIKTSIVESVTTTTTHYLNLSIVKLKFLRNYENFTLSSMENQSLYNTSYT